MLGTRPDLAFPIYKLAQYCTSPTERHWKGVKRILRFVKGSVGVKLILGNREECGILRAMVVGYFDSAYMYDTHDRHSTMGYIFFIAGSAVHILVLEEAKSCRTQYHRGRVSVWNRGYERGSVAEILSIGTGSLHNKDSTSTTKKRQPKCKCSHQKPRISCKNKAHTWPTALHYGNS